MSSLGELDLGENELLKFVFYRITLAWFCFGLF